MDSPFTQDEGTYTSVVAAPSNSSFNNQFRTPQQIPLSVFTSANRKKMSLMYDPKQRYQIFLAPDSLEDLRRYCFSGIGKSGTLCIEQNCRKSHTGPKYEIDPGSILIRKTSNKAFLEPITSSTNLHLDLIGTWLSDSCTLSEWVRRFGLIESKLEVDQSNPITSKDIKEEETIQQNALALLTSRKRKAPASIDQQPKLTYNSDLNLPQDPQVPVPHVTLQAALINMNKGITAVTNEVGIIADNLTTLQVTSDSTALVCDQKVKDIDARIGTKPDFLDEDFDGPTLWSTLTQLAAQLSHITKDLDHRIVSQINQMRPMIELDRVKLFQQEIIGVHNRMDILKDQLVKLAKSLKSNASFGNDASTPSRNNLTASRFTLTSGVDERIHKLEEEIKLLKAINDSDAIRFLSLGFKSREEAYAWITLHYNFDSFGYIVEPISSSNISTRQY